MRIKSSNLKAAFSKVAHLATGRPSLPILMCVKLEAAENILTITATDIECYALARCECEGDFPPVCINARVFSTLISGEEMTLTADNSKLTVQGQGRAVLSLEDAAAFPAWPKRVDAKAIGLNCQDLADAIAVVGWCADDKQIARPICACVNVDCTAKSIKASCVNGKQLSCCEKLSIAAPCSFMIREQHASTLIDALESEGCEFSIMENFVSATAKGFACAVRIMEGQWFDIARIMNDEREIIGIIETRPVIDALSSIASLAIEADMSAPCEIDFSGKELRISFEGRVNSFEKSMPMKSGAFHIRAAATLLKQILENTDGDEIKASLLAQNALLLESGDVTNVLQLLTLEVKK